MPIHEQRARRSRKKGIPSIPVNSFSDIAFLLIIFFIIATTLDQIAGIVTNVPAAEKSDVQTGETTTISLNGSRIQLNGQAVSLLQLRTQLAQLSLRDKPDEQRIVLLESSANTEYQTYFEAMTAISTAGGVIAMVSQDEQSESTDTPDAKAAP